MNCLLVMKIKWSLAYKHWCGRAERGRTRAPPAGATVVGDDVIASTGYMKKQPVSLLFVHFIFLCFSFLIQYMFVVFYFLFSRCINKHKGDYGRRTEAV